MAARGGVWRMKRICLNPSSCAFELMRAFKEGGREGGAPACDCADEPIVESTFTWAKALQPWVVGTYVAFTHNCPAHVGEEAVEVRSRATRARATLLSGRAGQEGPVFYSVFSWSSGCFANSCWRLAAVMRCMCPWHDRSMGGGSCAERSA